MITDTINPKFKILDSTAQASWFLYLIIKDHKTHQFFYSIDTLADMTGHTKVTIIKANNQLEANNIISTEKSHRKQTVYTVLEKIKLSKGDTAFLLSIETIPKEEVRVQKLYPTGIETILKEDNLGIETIPHLISSLSNDLSSLSNTPNSLSTDKWKYEGWREHFNIGKKLIENQYPFFFTNIMKGNISNEQYRMIAFIGKSGDKAIPVISEKASKAKDPINIIAWAYEELSGNGKKPYQQNEATPYKDNEKKLAEDRAIHEKKLKGEYYE